MRCTGIHIQVRLETFAKSDKSTGMNDMKCLLCIVPVQAYKAFVLFYGAYEHSLLNGAATMYDAVKAFFPFVKIILILFCGGRMNSPRRMWVFMASVNNNHFAFLYPVVHF